MIANVVLDADTVTHNMATRLSTCSLGHVLFLKNQVPFPVVQLARMPRSDASSRAAKMKQDLITSFDTLASHLYTTFIALSTSLALRDTAKPEHIVPVPATSSSRTGRVFMAIVLGPTIGTAKARVILGIDGFEVKMWGMAEDTVLDGTVERDSGESGADTDKSDHVSSSESDSNDTQSTGSSPPPSRSPSPSLSSSTSSSSDIPDRPDNTRTPPQDPLRAAERLLSQTLASAWAEDTNGQGLASEMAPTHTHILIRAPRRFTHPSWTQRQNISGAMDAALDAFLFESGEVVHSEGVDATTNSAGARTRKQKKGRVEGVWIRARGDWDGDGDGNGEVAEEDEWIWWSWDGKLSGFADW
ncbi:hypothetical protein SCLCIDRAFT_123340 [Scleroderma citrinum Foug A]|uniref:Uncharacterized protein n=1 Tax=Scleroderma citrinum Foug A TaxID=1036808 RepID=A0A0C2ZGK0_9AGAM|nr:hypothetical protein SCLCIDRAFT_123340 [Scleroderma citrinum Foug A]